MVFDKARGTMFFRVHQVRHGNLSCVKALVEEGAWLRQRNTQGFTPREDLLNAKPTFPRGRLPKILRATLEYIERAEVGLIRLVA